MGLKNYIVKAHTSFVGHTGYNKHSQDFFRELDKLIPVRVRNFTVDNTWEASELDKKLLVEQTHIGSNGFEIQPSYSSYDDLGKEVINIVLNETNHHYFYDSYTSPKIAYNAWESTLQPPHFFEKLLEFDQLWVPTEWQRRCSIDQGFPENRVKVVPEAVDGLMYKPFDQLYNYKDHPIREYRDGRFKFILFGRWDYRKCTKEIIETFLKTFKRDEQIDLVIGVDNPFAVDGCKSTEERLEFYGFGDPRIKIKHFMSDEDYLTYIKTGHVFVSCARSEGWNRPLAEAMACGVPTISTDWGAQLEFTTDQVIFNGPLSHRVKIVDTRSADLGRDSSYAMGKSDVVGVHGTEAPDKMVGEYCEPDFNHLSEVMREVYTNYAKKYLSEARINSARMRVKYSLENAAKVAYYYLNELINPKTKITFGSQPEKRVKMKFIEDKRKTAFITGGDQNFMPLIKTCVESLNKYSDIPVIVYGFDCTVPFSFSNMVSKMGNQLEIDSHSKYGRDTSLYYGKVKACLSAINDYEYENYIWLDGDCIVTQNIDSLLNYTNSIKQYPLCMRYRDEYMLHWRDIDGKRKEALHGEEVGNILKLKRNNNFTVATGLFMFNSNSKMFFEEVLSINKTLIETDSTNFIDDMALAEERLFNALFWKYNYKEFLPITWLTKKVDYDFLIPKLKKINRKFDIMYIFDDDPFKFSDDQSKILFYHFYKGYKNVTDGENLLSKLEVDRLMIVAHPDDESIFAGGSLLNKHGWKVVCATLSQDEVRKKEFEKAMRFAGVEEYEIWDFSDGISNKFNEEKIRPSLERVLKERPWKKILTHNSKGEYGHIQHKELNRLVLEIIGNRFYTFEVADFKMNENLYRAKKELLHIYKSQVPLLPEVKEYISNEKMTKNKLSDDTIKLNLGCGRILKPGYINIDKFDDNADVIMDALDLKYNDNSVDEIYSSHLLEHLSNNEMIEALKEWRRVLETGGLLELNLPDFESSVKTWLEASEHEKWGTLLNNIFGDQSHEGQFHKTGFTKERIVNILDTLGFDKIYAEVHNRSKLHKQECIEVSAIKKNYIAEVDEVSKKVTSENDIFVLGCFPNDERKLNVLKDNIKHIKASSDIPILLTSHYPIPIDVQESVDYVIYDKENILSEGETLEYWFEIAGYIYISGPYGTVSVGEVGKYQPVAIINAIVNSLNFCSEQFEWIHYLESDTKVNVQKYVSEIRKYRDKGKQIVGFQYDKEQEHFVRIGIVTNIFSFNIASFKKYFKRVNTWDEYVDTAYDLAKRTGLVKDIIFENWLYNFLTANTMMKEAILLDDNTKQDVIIERNQIDRGTDNPRYLGFLSETKKNEIMMFLINDTDEIVSFQIKKDDEIIFEGDLAKHALYWKMFSKQEDSFDIYFEGKFLKTLRINPNKIYNEANFKFLDDKTNIEFIGGNI